MLQTFLQECSLSVYVSCSPGQAEYDSPNVLLTVKQKTRLLDLLALRINKVCRQHINLAFPCKLEAFAMALICIQMASI